MRTRDDVKKIQEKVFTVIESLLDDTVYQGEELYHHARALRELDKLVPIKWGEED